MIITVPCTHPYFLEFMEKEAGTKLSSKLYPDEMGLPIAFLCMWDNQVVGAAMLANAELSAQINQGHIHDDSPWLMGLFVKESERNKGVGKTIVQGVIHYSTNKFHEIHFNTESAQEFYQKHWHIDSMGSDIIHTPEGEIKTDYFRMNIERNYLVYKPLVMNLDELFIYLCKRDQIEQLDKLLACSEININSTDDYDINGLMIAAKRGSLEMLQYLIAKGVNIYHQDEYAKNNILIHAVAHKHLHIVKYLLTSKETKEHTNIHHRNSAGNNALMYACEHANSYFAQYLIIEQNMNINKDTMDWLINHNKNEVLEMIQARDLYQKMNDSLDKHGKIVKYRKI